MTPEGVGSGDPRRDQPATLRGRRVQRELRLLVPGEAGSGTGQAGWSKLVIKIPARGRGVTSANRTTLGRGGEHVGGGRSQGPVMRRRVNRVTLRKQADKIHREPQLALATTCARSTTATRTGRQKAGGATGETRARSRRTRSTPCLWRVTRAPARLQKTAPVQGSGLGVHFTLVRLRARLPVDGRRTSFHFKPSRRASTTAQIGLKGDELSQRRCAPRAEDRS